MIFSQRCHLSDVSTSNCGRKKKKKTVLIAALLQFIEILIFHNFQ